MRENEFEKQVKEKMDDFHLRPSPEVWADVERRIRREKKRRIIFWWPLLLLLVAGSIATAVLLGDKKNTAVKDAADKDIQADITTTSAKKNTEPVSDTGQPATVSDNNNTKIDTTTPNKTTATSTASIVAGPVTGNRITVNSHMPASQVIENGNGAKKKTTAKGKPPITTPDIIVTTGNSSADTAATLITTAIIAPKKKTTVIGQKVSAAQLNENLTNEKEPAVNKKDKKVKKWQTEINVSAGRSSVVNGIGAGLFKSGRLETADALGGVPALATYSSTPIYYGTSAGIGVNIQRPVSKKLQLGFGLSYNYLSNRMNVGNRVDSSRVVSNNFSAGAAVNNFYQPSNSAISNNYRNQYHFVLLSADLSWRIADGKKIKLDWKNSLQYGLLVGSNMLHFDRNLPGYYQDNTLLNKGQLFLSTGFSMPVGNKVRINPFVNYSLTPVLKKTNNDKTYYADFGIRFHFLLNKK